MSPRDRAVAAVEEALLNAALSHADRARKLVRAVEDAGLAVVARPVADRGMTVDGDVLHDAILDAVPHWIRDDAAELIARDALDNAVAAGMTVLHGPDLTPRPSSMNRKTTMPDRPPTPDPTLLWMAARYAYRRATGAAYDACDSIDRCLHLIEPWQAARMAAEITAEAMGGDIDCDRRWAVTAEKLRARAGGQT